MLEVQDALKLLLDAVHPLDAVELALAEALSKTLAEAAVADRDFPPTDRSAMDGFAVRAADGPEAGRTLVVRGEVRAGHDPKTISVGAGEAVRIFTGAVIPHGADAVVMVEATVEDRASRTVTVNERTEPGQHIRRRGEAIREGATVVEVGTRVGPAEVAALAAVGRTRVRVVRTPRVAVISTGDEVVETDTRPAPHQVRNSNAAMLMPNLAVSLHATTDETRNRIAPINRKYSLEQLLDACRRFPLKRRNRITFEYVLLDGVNDTPEDARRLVRLLGDIKAKVNLLPLNAAPGIPYERPSDDRVNAFAQILADHHITVSVRKSRGRDIRAACGQLIVEGQKKSAGARLAGLME